jgi:hypothetical protein
MEQDCLVHVRVGLLLHHISLFFAGATFVVENDTIYFNGTGDVGSNFTVLAISIFALAGVGTGAGAAAYAVAYFLAAEFVFPGFGPFTIAFLAFVLTASRAIRTVVLPVAFIAVLNSWALLIYMLFIIEHAAIGDIGMNFAVSVSGSVSVFYVIAFALVVAAVRGAVALSLAFVLGLISVSVFALVSVFIFQEVVDIVRVVISGIVSAIPLYTVVCGAAAAAAVGRLSDAAVRNQRHGALLLSLFLVMMSGCLVAARFGNGMPHASPPLLFLGLLTLLNSPFDWASLGLTRALLRRGLELKNWRPFVLALAAAVAAAIIVALLPLTIVIGVQTFDAMAVHGGGAPVLPLERLLDGIAAHPEAPNTGGSMRCCSRR